MTIKPTYQELENRLNELECEIIKNRQIGDALRESEQNLSVTLDSIGDAMIATDVIGNVTRMNPVAQMLTGWDINDAIGLPITDIFNIVNAKTRKTVENPVKQVLREGRIVGLANHTLLISKDGSEYQIADSGSPIKTENGEMCGVVLVFRDVTKEYNIQQQLIESEELFRNLVETTGTGFCIGDANAKIIAANKEFLRIVGQKNINDVLNHYILDWTAPYDIKRTIEAFKEFQTKGAARNFDMDIVRSDGNIIPISINANVASVKGIDHIFVLSTDITERKKIEKELKDSEELLRRSQEFSNMISWDTDILNDSIRWSGDVESHYGYSAKELNNIKAFYKSIHPDDFAKVDESLMESINNGCDYRSEFRVVWPDGSVHWLLAWGNALRDADGRATNMIGMGRDITEYKQAELALRESEEKYRHLVEHANDGIALVQETILEYVNPRYAEILGYSVDEMIGTRYSDYISPHEKDRVINIYKSRLAGEDVPPRYETILVRKDGKEIIVEINASLITFGGKQSHFVIIRDMTERKRAEEERDRLKNQLHHSQRMEAIGTLAGGIAHDFNNLLMGIQGRTSLMMMDIDGSHPFFEHLMGIEDYIHSAADLTKQLLGFARGGKYYVKPTDLNDLIRKTSSMFARTRKEIRIHEKYNNELWTVDVDQGQIEQAVLNMYVNAWQAMPAGGDLYIETENVVLDKNYIKPYDVQPGEYVKTSITDTGVGMDKKVQQRIFEPFFTTKDMGRGTGLGLASVYGIIKNHGGIINVYSEKGHGSTFSFYLPVTDKEIVIESEYSKEVVKGEGIVLIVDDEDMILDVGERLLDSFGYIVLKANNGYDAIEIYKKEMNNIKLVILDMIMPGLSGGETYDKLREINPDIKVLLSSGYSINGEASDIINRGCNGFIQKPYNMKQLSQKIFEILNRK